MRLLRRVIANGENAKKSSGPISQEGRERSSQNARRHGLSVDIDVLNEYREEIDALAREIAGDRLDTTSVAVATEIASAEIDLKRVRSVKEDLLSKKNSVPEEQPIKIKKGKKGEARMLLEKIEIIHKSERPINNQEALLLKLNSQYSRLVSQPEERSKSEYLTKIVNELIKLERYEQRALFRRDRAIKKFFEI